MKSNQQGDTVEIRWLDHQPGCEPCRSVDIERSATFAKACAMGSRLLMEELAKRQSPVESQKRREVQKWAEEAGTFIKDRAKINRTKYVGD